MSALDRLMNKNASEPTPASNPIMKMLGGLIPPALVEQLAGQVSGTVQYFKDNQDLILRQQSLIITQQQAIMTKLGIDNVRSDDNGGNSEQRDAA